MANQARGDRWGRRLQPVVNRGRIRIRVEELFTSCFSECSSAFVSAPSVFTVFQRLKYSFIINPPPLILRRSSAPLRSPAEKGAKNAD